MDVEIQTKASEHLDHLRAGGQTVVPFAMAGHFARESEQASPVVELPSEHEVSLDGLHPYSDSPAIVCEGPAGVFVVAVDRIAHDESCERCRPIWDRVRSYLEDVPADGAVSGGISVHTEKGPGLLLVDVWDLPDEAFTDEEGAGHDH